jgi:hypothetical protein
MLISNKRIDDLRAKLREVTKYETFDLSKNEGLELLSTLNELMKLRMTLGEWVPVEVER